MSNFTVPLPALQDDEKVDKQVQDSQNYDQTLKVCVVGEASVGKTSIVSRYVKDDFNPNYKPTIGMDFSFRSFALKNGQTIRAQIWDTAGQERFRALSNAYYKGTHGVVLVFDISNRESFDNLANVWIKQIQEQAPAEVMIIIVANKADLRSTQDESTLVPTSELKQIEKSFPSVKCFECSAKNGTGVVEAFDFLTAHACKRVKQPNLYVASATNNTTTTTTTSSNNNTGDVVSPSTPKQPTPQQAGCNGVKSKSEDM